ncbi:hypothetical protein V8F20_007047 [Naviculisporaceae sp. PSN 640]
MAQGSVISMTTQNGPLNGGGTGNGSPLSSLPSDKLEEIRQYEKLLRFCDDVSGGSHPRIKPKLSQLQGKSAQEAGAGAGSSTLSNATNSAVPTRPQNNSAISSKTGNQHVVDNSRSFQANSQQAPLNPYPSLPGLKTLSALPGGPAKHGHGKVEINPVLLEKSDDLIKVEFRLQRQKVERDLREQMGSVQKASGLAEEALADFDVMDILNRVLAAQKMSAQLTDEIAANASASSDSFDDNTFYSSQNVTPQSQQLSRIPDNIDDENMRDASPYEPEFEPEPAVAPSPEQDAAQSSLLPGAVLRAQEHSAPSISTPSSILPHGSNTVPGLSSEATSVSRAFRQLLSQEGASSQGSGPASRSEDSLSAGQGRTADARDLARVNERLLNPALHTEDSPVVRAHDLSPIAPQPAHVSPLVVAHQQQLALSDSSGRRGTPAQVAALRKQPSAATSPESSPQANRALERKKKKKKRKADKLAAEAAAASPYIKPEPRSPSPLSAQTHLRPAKRQRQSRQQPSSAAQHDPRFDQAIIVDDGYGEPRYDTRPYREDRALEYRQGNEAARLETEQDRPLYPRVERVYYDDARPAPGNRQGAPNSPGAHQIAYGPREVRGGRSVSNIIGGAYGDSASYIRDAPAAASRIGTRPAEYHETSGSPVTYERVVGPMGPPRPPTRIIVDQFGREYIEPPRPPIVSRDGAVPEPRPLDSEILYGRPPPSRAISRRPDLYEEQIPTYRPAESTYPPPRRVVTQPELAGLEPRGYRDRGYSTHELPPSAGEYLPPRARPDVRTVVEPPREYIARSASVRPFGEQGRYEGPNVAAYERRPQDDYYGVRATSVRPPEGTRYEIPVAYERRIGGEEPFLEYTAIRSASVRPAEPIRYEVARDFPARVGSVRPEIPVGAEYAAVPPPPARAFSVHPGEGAPPHNMRPAGPGVAQATERYYGRPPVQNDEEVVFLDRLPRDMYRQGR